MKSNRREFTKGEELANAISHLTGTVLAAAGLILMIVYSAIRGDAWHITTTAIFGSALVILYLSSTFTHWLKPGRAKNLFFLLDQIAIFLLIAGTYTPIALVTLRGDWGWLMFGIEWGMAIAGIIYRISRPNSYESGVGLLSVILYALMGWLFLFFLLPVLRMMPMAGIIWIFTGGVFYTLGIIFFMIKRIKYHHLIWHLFVIGGSMSHFFAVFFYIIP